MSGLGRTRKRIVDISGGFPGMINDRSDQFLKFLETNSEDAYKRPWHRLERGMRLNRLRLFVEEETKRFQLSDAEKGDLYAMLVSALDKKQLNSKSIVTYDHEQQKIMEIKGLNFHKTAEGKVTFFIQEKRTGTLRKKATLSDPKVAMASEPKMAV
jgi:hypothetical protein